MMKKFLKSKKRILWLFIVTVLICLGTITVSFAAGDDFDKKIAAFPDSYKPYLKELHKLHPNWEFEPFFTQMDFNTSVDSELGAKSLVSSSAGSEIFKSKDAGDYDYSKNKYIEKDGGFVEANRVAVAYFMDPRNFLNEDGIFMFETLSYSDSFTVDSVENVLKGSFMANKKITYYDKDGKQIKTSTKYSKAILDAAKKYNVNPCFLASKILNEVGTNGSKSVSGDHSSYPGIYNFYNIGAYDGANAIAKGLKWASTGDTYSRPWTTPVKSINGGAEYIASSYIACGQFTGYLQRFNVNPNGKYKPYDHQYMTNLTGALSQGYSTYVSYVKSGLIDNKYVFSIPVYENMPSESSLSGKGELADAYEQNGSVTADACFVRTGPSTYYSQIADPSGNIIKLTKGEPVKIIGKVCTDTDYYLSVLKYPYWYKISFTLADVTYEGYIPVNFVDISTQIHVGIGEYEPYFVTSNDEVDMHLVSYNTQIATITPEGKINFLKKGTVTIGAYDSTGNFDKVKYVVNKGEFPMPTDVKFTDIKSTSLVLDFIPSALAQNYEVIAVNSEGAVSHRDIATAAPYTVNVFNSVPDKTSVNRAKKSIKGTVTFHWSASDKNSKNRVYIRAVVDDSAAVKKYGPVISLTANSSIGGYEVYSYDSVTGEYTKIQTFAPSVTSYTVPKAQAADGIFAVRAFGTVQDETVYGDYSAMVDMKKIPAKVTGMALSDVKSTGYTLTWNEVSGAKYILYKYTDGEYKSFKTFSKPQYKATKLKASDYTKLKLVAYKTSDGISYESAYTDVFSVTTLPSQVKNFKISATDIGGKLKWTKVPSATGYDIYIYSSKKKKYVKHATAKKNSYQLTGRTPGKIYNVRIIPKIKTTYGTFYGEKTDLEFRTNPGKVTSVKASSTSTTGFTLTWNETKATSRYYVYQYSAKKKKYVKIAEVKNPTYTLKGLSTGKTYKFKIKTVKLSDGKILCSSTSDAFSFTTLPGKVTALKASSRKKTQFTVSWSEVSGAEAYQIFMYDKEKKDYVRIATVEGKTSYRVKGLKAGSSNKFRVRALKKLNGKNYYGQKSDVFTFTTKK